MKLSRIAILAIFCAAGLNAQSSSRSLEDRTNYGQDGEQNRQLELKSTSGGTAEERLEHAFADLKSLNQKIEKLSLLSGELKAALANDDPSVLRKATLKRMDEIEKLARDVRAGLKRAAMVARID